MARAAKLARAATGARAVAVAVVLSAGVACAPPAGEDFLLGDFLLGGIQVDEPDMHAWHERLLEHGFDAVSLTAYARQRVWDSADLRFEAPKDSATLRELRAARSRGLRVVLVLRLELDTAEPRNRFLWHGRVMAPDEADLASWFARWGEFVLGWAAVAEREGVELFGIASELTALTSTAAVDALPVLEEYYLNEEKQAQERARLLGARGTGGDPLVGDGNERIEDLGDYHDEGVAARASWARKVTGDGDVEWVVSRRRLLERHWRELVSRVREIYHGELTYAANFDQVTAVGFWDALDVIGINAYYPLRSGFVPGEDPATLQPLLEASWRRVLGELDALRRERGLDGKPVVFTELGYTARAGSTVNPWAGTGFAALDRDPAAEKAAAPARIVVWEEQALQPLERAVAIRALARASRDVAPGMLRGLLWWKLSTVPSHREIEPFVVILGERGGSEDPVLEELRALADRRRDGVRSR